MGGVWVCDISGMIDTHIFNRTDFVNEQEIPLLPHLLASERKYRVAVELIRFPVYLHCVIYSLVVHANP